MQYSGVCNTVGWNGTITLVCCRSEGVHLQRGLGETNKELTFSTVNFTVDVVTEKA